MNEGQVLVGQRYALLTASGAHAGDWTVMNVYPMPDGRLRVTLANADDPDDTLELYADELADPTRFRYRSEPATANILSA